MAPPPSLDRAGAVLEAVDYDNAPFE